MEAELPKRMKVKVEVKTGAQGSKGSTYIEFEETTSYEGDLI